MTQSLPLTDKVLTPSFPVFAHELQRLFLLGYRLHPTETPVVWGTLYEASVYLPDDNQLVLAKSGDTLSLDIDHSEDDEPPEDIMTEQTTAEEVAAPARRPGRPPNPKP